MKKQEGLQSKEIKKAAQILKRGGIVIFPTDTVYGMGCCFDNQKAKERLYKIKGTPKSQPFPILVSSIGQVKALAKITKIASRLIHEYWPGGLTILLSAKRDSLRIGFRMPNSQLLLSIIEEVGVSIIGTSANFHDAKTPTRFEELDPRLVELADYVIKGRCQGRIESTVVDATVGPFKILRRGAVSFDDFED